MAHLLGSRYCIESLRSDVTDLQGAIIDVFSRVGPIRTPSWKYPDKISSDLDLTELLEIHDYSEDEEERQLAHIVLLELVIDRLVLLLQSMSKYTDQVLHPGSVSGQSSQHTTSTSIGLVVKKYWNKVVQLGTYIHQVQTENKNKARIIADLEASFAKLTQDGSTSSSTGLQYVKLPLNDADASRLLSGTVSSASNYSISRDECIKSTQTVETAFVPCESCDLVQRHFRQVGDMVVNICNTHDLPCSLIQHKSKVEKLDWMCGTDVARWATEQNKDLARINKHISDLLSTRNNLQKDLEKEQRMNQQLMNRLSECAKEILLERETQSVQQQQYETKIKTLEKKCQDEVCKVQREKQSLEKAKAQLESQMKAIKKQLEDQESLIEKLENTKQQIKKDMEEKMINKVNQLEDELETVRLQLAQVNEQLETAKKELNRERAKNKSVNRQTESLQDKQENLIHRLDVLDLENEELRNQIIQLEEEKEQLEEKVEKLKDERRQLNRQLEDEKRITRTLTLEKEKLQKTMEQVKSDLHQMEIQVQEVQEHERLLVEYPDLNGPVNPDLSGTGDIVQDMENQIKANVIRIRVLEEENTKLRNSIAKLLATQSVKREIPIQPVALWKVKESTIEDDSISNVSCDRINSPELSRSNHQESSNTGASTNDNPGSYSKQSKSSRQGNAPGVRQSFVIGKGAKSARSRPASGKAIKSSTNQTASSIHTYKQLKKAGLLKVGQSNQHTENSMPHGDRDYQPQETFSCPKCDKMYSSLHDLELHRSYCYGGI